MPRYRLKDAEIRSIALAKRGANRQRFALLKEQATGQLEHVVPILKAADDWTVAYIVMAEPGAVEDGGMLAPGVEDVWDAAEIAKAAHSFLRNGGLTTGAHFMDATIGRPVENFVAPLDFTLGDQLVKTGSWVLGFEPSAEARALIESGEMTGMSVEGTGVRELVDVAKADPPHGAGVAEESLSPDALAAYLKLRKRGVSHAPAMKLARRAVMAKAAPYTALHPPIGHGGDNWVTRRGGLPGPIDAIARVLAAKGTPESEAVAIAVSQAKKQCATGLAAGGHIQLGGEARATICKAVADWEAMKASTVAKANPYHVPAGSPSGGQRTAADARKRAAALKAASAAQTTTQRSAAEAKVRAARRAVHGRATSHVASRPVRSIGPRGVR